MAARRSAGLLLHRRAPDGSVEVLLAHMGGPFWARKDDAAWSIPKGEHGEEEDPLAAARREFAEELGQPVPPGPLVDLGELRQPSGKRLRAFALEADLDVTEIHSNSFTIEWPPGTGRLREFPEIDRAEWFGLESARRKLVRGQVPLLDTLVQALAPR
jgi:predicted NUDIX family NTP pyrophosphohydrolase